MSLRCRGLWPGRGAGRPRGVAERQQGVGTATITASTNLATGFFTFTRPDFGANFIGFQGESDTGALAVHYLDNVIITSVPEPATLSLLGLGALALLRRRRRG